MRHVNPQTGMVDFEKLPDWSHRQRRARPGELQDTIRAGVEAATDECLIWPFSIEKSGYGHVGGKLGKSYHTMYVHRIVCIAAHGPAPPDKPLATHRCGNRPCVNAKHLRWGSYADNMADAIAHGRVWNL